MAWLLAQACRTGRDGRNYWWVAPVHAQAMMVFRRYLRMFRRDRRLSQAIHANKTELSLTMPNGAVMSFHGSDRPDTLYGEDVYAAVVDEATRCREDAWHAVRSTLTATGGPVRCIGNVRGRHNWCYTLARRAESGDPSMAYHRLTAYDAVEAGVLQRDEVEDARRQLPEHVFRELYLAEPSDDGGNPFGRDAIAASVGPHMPGEIVAIGIDLAKSQDYTAVVGIDADGAIGLCDRWQSDWGATRRRIVDIVRSAGEPPTLIDSTGVGDPIVEDLCRDLPSAEGFRFSNTTKQQIMEGLASAIQRSLVMIPDREFCRWLVTELDSFGYHYVGSRVYYSAPQGLHDDGVCALALCIRARDMQIGPAIVFGSRI